MVGGIISWSRGNIPVITKGKASMVQITLQEIENMNKKQLKQAIRNCFEYAPEASPVDRLAVLLEAQLYSRELERRSDSWVSWRDLVLEVVVIALIGWEILMGYQQQTHQDQTFEKEKTIWEHMDTSTKATADTLLATQGTMEAMRNAEENQLKLFYDINMNTLYVASSKGLSLINNGRTNVTLWELKIGTGPRVPEKEPRVITPNAGFQVSLQQFYDLSKKNLAKDSLGQTPLDVFVKNEKGEKFTVQGYLVTVWTKDDIDIRTQTTSVTPGWNVEQRPANVIPNAP
jgi:hypothetical protein